MRCQSTFTAQQGFKEESEVLCVEGSAYGSYNGKEPQPCMRYQMPPAAASQASACKTYSPCLPPHTLQMLFSCCTESARGIRSSTWPKRRRLKSPANTHSATNLCEQFVSTWLAEGKALLLVISLPQRSPCCLRMKRSCAMLQSMLPAVDLPSLILHAPTDHQPTHLTVLPR